MLFKRIETGFLSENCYIIASTTKNAVIIDPGANEKKILSAIEKMQVVPQYILLTHGHFDHVGAVTALKTVFPNIKIAISTFDAELVDESGKSLPINQMNDDKYFTPDILLEDMQKIVLDELTFTAILVPGHTKGCVAFLCGDILVTGDMLFHGDVGRCDLYGGNYDTMKQSIRKLIELVDFDAKIYPGHNEETTLFDEKKYNSYIREAVADEGAFDIY